MRKVLIDEGEDPGALHPNLGLTHNYLGSAYQAKGNHGKAINELQKATLLDARTGLLASLAHGYTLASYARKAQNILKDLEEQSKRGYVAPYDIAIIYAGLGKKDRAFEWLAKSCHNQDVVFVSLNIDPQLDNLRSDPRFQDLLHCAGLAQ